MIPDKSHIEQEVRATLKYELPTSENITNDYNLHRLFVDTQNQIAVAMSLGNQFKIDPSTLVDFDVFSELCSEVERLLIVTHINNMNNQERLQFKNIRNY